MVKENAINTLINCEQCGELFQFETWNESFGMQEDNEFNIHKIECPKCGKSIIIKKYCDWSKVYPKDK